MENTDKKVNYGKKVLFLFPHSVIQEKLVNIIIRAEFEVYFIYDHKLALKFLQLNDDAVIFINIDEGLREPEWETYIRSIIDNEKTEKVRVGILTYNDEKALAEKYLMDIGVPCGFIKLKLGIEESAKIILKTLIANEARGQRKHVRANCGGYSNVSFNIRYKDDLLSGDIQNISAAGMACVFGGDGPAQFDSGVKFSDIQLVLKGKIAKVSGIVAGRRDHEGKSVHVILFDSPLVPDAKGKIHYFIHQALQEDMEKVLKTLQ